MAKKTDSEIVLTTGKSEEVILEAFLSEAEEIAKLAKLRSVLALGSNTDIRSKAEGVLSREISKRVVSLSASVIEMFKAQNEASDDGKGKSK